MGFKNAVFRSFAHACELAKTLAGGCFKAM